MLKSATEVSFSLGSSSGHHLGSQNRSNKPFFHFSCNNCLVTKKKREAEVDNVVNTSVFSGLYGL